ncbi:hypothetical protein V6N11_026058 [Hibiscus sabdariffa]|uniref:Putative plant transposon protein domain-containing protein n=1 Tax=Hibiscus sabdariffa TaxID=183260 RepID=A0ABR2SUK0_9ROSI
MANKTFSARYIMVPAKNSWEEQGFFFDDSQVNYGLEQFYTTGCTILVGSTLQDNQPEPITTGRVPANAATINAILGLPDNDPSFYAMLGAFEEDDFEQIKDYIYEEGTSWNTMGRNPHSVSRTSLQPEAKLWNTFVKRNLMLTSHNQTVDRTCLLLIHTIMTGYRVNIGEILAKELAAACANDKGILAFPCLISALCRRAAVPTSHGDKFQAEKTGWRRAVYMRKMDVADATPLNVAMPTPPASPIHTTAATADEAGPSAPVASAEPRHAPVASPPVVPVSSHTTKAAPPLHILQLRTQLQRIKARQLQFQEETKVFNQSLINFLCFQFPSAATFFTQPTPAPPQPNFSIAAQPQPSTNTSAKAGAIEEVQFSSDEENDVFDWQSLHDHLQPIGPTPSKPAEAVPILSAAPTPATFTIAELPTPDSPARKKGKATTSRSFDRNIPSSPEEEEPEQRPAKRHRRYHIITADSDDDNSAEILVAQPEKSADPSLY